LLSVLSKEDYKILVFFELIQNFKVLHFSMAKVKKVNIAVTWYLKTQGKSEKNTLSLTWANAMQMFTAKIYKLL
jgi:hypothetical protein